MSLDSTSAEAVRSGGESDLRAFFDACTGDIPQAQRFLRDHDDLAHDLIRIAASHLALTAGHAGALPLSEAAHRFAGPLVSQAVAELRRIEIDEEESAMRPGRKEYPDDRLVKQLQERLCASLPPVVRVALRR